MQDMTKDLLNAVCDLAIKVGHYQAEQRKTFNRDAVETKHRHDYVSYVDKESERMIVQALKELLPEAGFITEEKTTAQTVSADYEWIIDPLDGTTNYIHNLGSYCVCIALRHHGTLILGVVYEVTRDELFYATLGGGAYLRSADGSTTQLHVSAVGIIDDALFCLGYPYNTEAYRQFGLALIARLYGQCVTIRSLGSAETELCYVAAGRLDAFLESYLQAWDVCAGAIIIKEAGGSVTDYKGSDELWPSGSEVLATNGALHPAMIEVIRQCQAASALNL